MFFAISRSLEVSKADLGAWATEWCVDFLLLLEE